MRRHQDRNAKRQSASQERSGGWHAWQEWIRDPSLGFLLALQMAIIFVSAPLVAEELPLAEAVLDVLTWVMVVIVVLLSHRWGAVVSIAIALLLIAMDFSSTVRLPVPTSVFGHLGLLSALRL
jgi:hypothetical protein